MSRSVEAAGISMGNDWQIVPMGDGALLIQWREPDGGESVRSAHRRLGSIAAAEELELVPGIASLLVCFDPLRHDPGRLRSRLQELVAVEERLIAGEPRIVEIEVVYGGDGGIDLAFVAGTCGLPPEEVIALHTARPMPVLMLGFMPGFPYIGGLPSALRLPRRAEPRMAIPAGSVALANDQTGIYPARSPGGWHIIGRTNALLFDPRRDPPSLLMPGDLVQFVARGAT
jgi:KipI family sensor histidine kinase inhibitor